MIAWYVTLFYYVFILFVDIVVLIRMTPHAYRAVFKGGDFTFGKSKYRSFKAFAIIVVLYVTLIPYGAFLLYRLITKIIPAVMKGSVT